MVILGRSSRSSHSCNVRASRIRTVLSPESQVFGDTESKKKIHYVLVKITFVIIHRLPHHYYEMIMRLLGVY